MKDKISTYILKHRKLFILSAVLFPLIGIMFLVALPLAVKASFGSWGDSSLIHACKDTRGRVTLVSSSDTCNTGETQITWLKDVNAGDGLSITRNSSGATLSLANVDGWTTSSDTWTYVSANSFKISGVDRRAIFTKGTRVKLTNNSTTYYGVVIASSYATDTTVTLAANNDYSLVNSAITNPSYSYEANPQGYPTWFNYTPTYGGFSTDPGTMTAKFTIVGSACTLKLKTDTGGVSNATSFTASLPAAAEGTPDTALIDARDNSNYLTGPGMAVTSNGSATLGLYANTAFGNWTASGNKAIDVELTYQF